MDKPTLTNQTIVTRELFGGPDESFFVEMYVHDHADSTLVFLRESPQRKPSLNPVLPGAFEYIATLLRYELKYLQGRQGLLKFFHVQPEMAPTSTLRWGVNEVFLLLRNEQYVYSKRLPVHASLVPIVTEALSWWAPPQRTLR